MSQIILFQISPRIRTTRDQCNSWKVSTLPFKPAFSYHESKLTVLLTSKSSYGTDNSIKVSSANVLEALMKPVVVSNANHQTRSLDLTWGSIFMSNFVSDIVRRGEKHSGWTKDSVAFKYSLTCIVRHLWQLDPSRFKMSLFLCLFSLALYSAGSLAAPSPSQNIILRDLAVPRFFGAAANTTFLFHDVNYTKVIETQVGSVLFPNKPNFDLTLPSVLFSLQRMKVSPFDAVRSPVLLKCYSFASEMGIYRTKTQWLWFYRRRRDCAFRWEREC